MKKYIAYIIALSTISFGMVSCLDNDYDNATTNAVINPVTQIFEVRDSHHGEDLELSADVLSGAYMTTGIVTSDSEEGNMPTDELVIQAVDSKSTGANTKKSAAIILKLKENDNSTYSMGDSLVIDLRGTKLCRINGNLKITDISADKIKKIRSGVLVKPQTITLKDLYSNFTRYENMLVVVNADIYPRPSLTETLAGEKHLQVSNDSIISLTTESSAVFATKRLMPSAEFTGITYWNDSKMELKMRMSEDMQNACGPLYNNWPEDFEYPSIKDLGDKIPKSMTSYNSGDNKGIFKTGEWFLLQSILVDPELAGTLGRDRISGAQGIRMQQQLSDDALVQMNFDVTLGASKVTFSYGSYYNDASSTFSLEYSQDQGTTWNRIDDFYTNPGKTMQVATFMVNIDGNVRFRINKKGLGKTNSATGVNNGRLSIDNIYIYQNAW